MDLVLSAPEVDPYLAGREARFEDLTPGTAKSVAWAGAPGARTPFAVLYFHGFSATSMEARPLPERMAERLGANLFRTRLTGHGRPGRALAEATAEDWLRDVAEAMEVGRAVGDRTVLLGTSTGGTLALWAATRPEWEDQIAAAVVISANLGPRDSRSRMLLWPWGGWLARAVIGPERSWDPLNPAQARFWTTRYPTEALLPMMALVHMVRGVPSSDLGAPVLSLFSTADRIVAAEDVHAWAAGLDESAWRAVEVVGSDDPDQHVLAGDILSPGTTEDVLGEIVGFLEAVLAEPFPGEAGGRPGFGELPSQAVDLGTGGTAPVQGPL
ncbi:MAG: alpha/beta fold hydrolase [Gemmatimonadetes bacterium]|nr:alpha/beta fold hydrolase [Gemmatimonadota bacterium]